MEPTAEKQLAGTTSSVARVGDTVRKPSGPWDVGVQALLRHLEAVGFEGAPRALGGDEAGRSVVSYLRGTTCAYPMPSFVWEDETLTTAARLLRAYHDATVGFVAPADAGWQGSAPAARAEVICHNDVAPYNVVFRDRRPFALIDFDMAAPGPRVWDVAYAAYRFIPLDASDAPQEQGRRLGLFLDGYGAAFSADEALDAVVARLDALRAFMHERAASGDASFRRHIEEGHADVYRRAALHVRDRRVEILRGIG